MDAFYLLLLRRKGYEPTLRMVESSPFLQEQGIDIQRHILTHYLPKNAKVLEAGEGSSSRAGVQRSVSFIRCFLELLCPPRGLVLEMGSGTAPLLRACFDSGRPCYSFDSDHEVVDQILLPLLASHSTSIADESSTSADYTSADRDGTTFEEEATQYECPFD